MSSEHHDRKGDAMTSEYRVERYTGRKGKAPAVVFHGNVKAVTAADALNSIMSTTAKWYFDVKADSDRRAVAVDLRTLPDKRERFNILIAERV